MILHFTDFISVSNPPYHYTVSQPRRSLLQSTVIITACIKVSIWVVVTFPVIFQRLSNFDDSPFILTAKKKKSFPWQVLPSSSMFWNRLWYNVHGGSVGTKLHCRQARCHM